MITFLNEIHNIRSIIMPYESEIINRIKTIKSVNQKEFFYRPDRKKLTVSANSLIHSLPVRFPS